MFWAAGRPCADGVLAPCGPPGGRDQRAITLQQSYLCERNDGQTSDELYAQCAGHLFVDAHPEEDAKDCPGRQRSSQAGRRMGKTPRQ